VGLGGTESGGAKAIFEHGAVKAHFFGEAIVHGAAEAGAKLVPETHLS
jgi:hypothetical protein